MSPGPRRSLSTRVVESVLALLMLLLIGLVSAQIFMRYLVHSPLVWIEVLARMSFVYLTFIGAGLAFHRGENLRLAVSPTRCPSAPGSGCAPRRTRSRCSSSASCWPTAYRCSAVSTPL